MEIGSYFKQSATDSANSNENNELFVYERLPDGTYSIRLKDRSKCPDSIVVPTRVGGEKVLEGFENLDSEASYDIPLTVSTIADRGFSDCKDLTSIHIPKSVTYIGEEAFAGSGLVEITVDEENPVYHSDGNCVIETAKKTVVAGCSTSIIPCDDSVDTIGDYAFSGCSKLVNVTIPKNVRTIGQLAFHRCHGITSLTLEEGVETIAYGAFSSCDRLPDVKIPDGVRFIGAVAFAKCKTLKKAIIPASVEIIGGDIFSECESINEIIFEGNKTQWKNIHRADIMESGKIIYQGEEESSFWGLFRKKK